MQQDIGMGGVRGILGREETEEGEGWRVRGGGCEG